MANHSFGKWNVTTLIGALFISLGAAGCGAPAGNTTTGGSTNAVPLTTPTPGTIDCNTSQPDAIVAAVYAAIEQNKAFTREEWQFNVAVATAGSRKNIKVTGWSSQRDALYNLVTSTAVNCTPDGTEFKTSKDLLSPAYRTTVSCAAGHFACGDVCLPNGEVCKLTGASTAITPPANSNAAVNSNTNTNSKSDSAPSNSTGNN